MRRKTKLGDRDGNMPLFMASEGLNQKTHQSVVESDQLSETYPRGNSANNYAKLFSCPVVVIVITPQFKLFFLTSDSNPKQAHGCFTRHMVITNPSSVQFYQFTKYLQGITVKVGGTKMLLLLPANSMSRDILYNGEHPLLTCFCYLCKEHEATAKESKRKPQFQIIVMLNILVTPGL